MADIDRLTQREREVLRLMAAGRTNAEISQELSISFPTAKTHVSSILAKFGAASREEAVARWQSEAAQHRRGWVLPWLLLGVFGAGAVSVVLAGSALLRHRGGDSEGLRIDLAALELGRPTHFVVPSLGETPFGAPLGIWVTRGEDDQLTVFFDRDPHTGCAVRWQPEYEGGGYSLSDQYIAPFIGAYKDGCGGWVYLKDDGRIVFGASPRGLDSFDFAAAGDDLVVHLDRLILGRCRPELVDVDCSRPGAPMLVTGEPPPPAVPDWGQR